MTAKCQSLSSNMKCSFEHESRFHLQIAVPSLNHCYCVARKTQNGTRRNSARRCLAPNLPITPPTGAGHRGQTDYLQCDRALLLPRNGGASFPPLASYRRRSSAAAFPRSESQPEPEATQPHTFQFLCSRSSPSQS